MSTTETKIQRISRFFRLFFQVMIVILPCVQIYAWIIAPQPVLLFFGDFKVIPGNVEVLHHLSWATKFYGFLVSGVRLMLIELIIFYLIRLFRLYESGDIFTFANVNYIRKCGFALLTLQIVSPIVEGFLTLLVSWGNPHGHRVVAITITSLDLTLVITAFLVILISWIMSEGCRLREEQQLTI